MATRGWIAEAVEADETLRTAAELLQREANTHGLERFTAGTTLRWRIPGAARSILLLYPHEHCIELNFNRLYKYGWEAEAKRLAQLLPPLRNPPPPLPLYPRIRPEVIIEHFDSFRRDVLGAYVAAHRDITHL